MNTTGLASNMIGMTKNLLILACLITAETGIANAITLDNFKDYKVTNNNGLTVQNYNGSRLYDSIVQLNAAAVGGTRSIELSTVQAPRPEEGGEVVLGYLSNGAQTAIAHSSTLSGVAKTLLSYDGDDTVGLTNYSGLSLNLREGGADRLEFDVHYDLPFNSIPMRLEFTFYDKSDPTGNKFSRGIYIVDQAYQGATLANLSFAFSAFSIFGSNGAADLTNIGAFSVLFDGSNAPAADFVFSNLRTNGSDAPIPEPMSVGLLATGLIGLAKRIKRNKIS